eukprot:1243661-Amphidinium_carterae.1
MTKAVHIGHTHSDKWSRTAAWTSKYNALKMLKGVCPMDRLLEARQMGACSAHDGDASRPSYNTPMQRLLP